jgi:hypothetical protein
MKKYIYPIPFVRTNEEWVKNSINVSDNIIGIKHSIINNNPNSISTRYQAEFYKSIAVDIVTETVYNYPYPYISEKTLRPIACKRMFIIVGAPYTLKLLHNKGFETFSDVINESYDSIEDPNLRWYQLEKTIKSFVTKPLEEIQQILLSKKEILEKNFKTLCSLQQLELENV